MFIESVQIGVRALSTVGRWAAPVLVRLMLGAAVVT